MTHKCFGNITANLMITLMLLLNGFGCIGQVNKNENIQVKSIAQTEVTEIYEQGDNLILNQYKDSKKEGLWSVYYKNGKFTMSLQEVNYGKSKLLKMIKWSQKNVGMKMGK